MADEKIYSIQPRFKIGDIPTGWSIVDGIFRLPSDVPMYGTEWRDLYLSMAWTNEPMTAGVFSTWVERAKTVDWKVTGGRRLAKQYANLFQQADNGMGWDYHQAACALDYLTLDKGQMEELGRELVRCPECKGEGKLKEGGLCRYCNGEKKRPGTDGKVLGLQHLDGTRLIRMGEPDWRWRYYPDYGKPVSIPDANLLQVCSLPSGRDRFRGLGYCAMSRLLDAKELMLGYLVYFRQEIGNLPPELAIIIQGLPATKVEDSLRKYKEDRRKADLDKYGKIWWLGTDDISNPVTMSIHNLTVPNKSFSFSTMIEWWAKLLALNTGQDVGEYWLLQSGESKTVQSVQAHKSEGKGFASFLEEKERLYNTKILPYGVLFEFDESNDEQDKARADILASNILNLKNLAEVGVSRQEPIFTAEEIRTYALKWNVIEPGEDDESVPAVIGSTLKHLADPDIVWVDRYGAIHPVRPLLTGREAEVAMTVYRQFGQLFGLNGQHQPIGVGL